MADVFCRSLFLFVFRKLGGTGLMKQDSRLYFDVEYLPTIAYLYP